MRLRTTLTLGILVATGAMFVAVGFVAIPAAKAPVRAGVDARLRADAPAVRAAFLAGAEVPPAFGGREHAVLLVEGGRTIVLARSGLASAPDAPPVLPPRTLVAPGQIAYADAPDGTKYRYTTVAAGSGRRLAIAAPVDDVRRLVDELVWRALVVGGIGCLGLAVVTWWWIRRTTRPIERLTERAGEIAAGDGDRSLAVSASTVELRRLAQALDTMIANVDESEARLREFVANASHELRTPLTIISGYLQLDLEGEARDRTLRRALTETTRMRRIVADLQLLTELDEDIRPAPTELDLNPIVRDALYDAELLDPQRTWQAELAPGELRVHGDADQLRQVVANLLANVRVHTPADTPARVRTRRAGEVALLEVTDSGPGVPSDELPHLFNRFWRHDRSRSRASGGSGLGLSIVASIVEGHRGSVTAALCEDGGLSVTVQVPVIAAIPDALRAPASASGTNP